MKTIIAGGRNYYLTEEDYNFLDNLLIIEVVSGGATGADKCGEEYAKRNNLLCKIFPANWEKYKKAAGHIRNRKMAKYADAVVLFTGGKGTENMFQQAKEYKLKIYDRRHIQKTPGVTD